MSMLSENLNNITHSLDLESISRYHWGRKFLTYRNIQLLGGTMHSDKEKCILFNCANRTQGQIVEIGAYKGLSTTYLAAGVKLRAFTTRTHACHVITIDPFIDYKGRGGMRENEWTREDFAHAIYLAGVSSHIDCLEMTSRDAEEAYTADYGDPAIELLFIDGDHTSEGAHFDFETYFPKVSLGGVIAIHDSCYGGPCEVIQEYSGNDKPMREVHRCDDEYSLTLHVKVAEL